MNRCVLYVLLLTITNLVGCQKTELKEPILDAFTSANFEMKGLSFVAMRNAIDSSAIQPLNAVNCNYIAQMPFAFGQLNSTEVIFNNQYQWWGETDAGIVVTTQLARDRGIKTMLKPQIWFRDSYPGAFDLSTESDWTAWERNYENYILHFAHLADSLHIELFCIGTELRIAVAKRPQFWSAMIDSIRTFYDGKLTYAANWDDYKQVSFWEKLDYIGIDAYFPLSDEKTPAVSTLVNGWQKDLKEIDDFRLSKNKEVIFTEIGYKSVDYCTKEPWDPSSKTINLLVQQNALQAFFVTFGNKPWFKGAFLWKWYPNHQQAGGDSNADYTPQNKPAEEIVKIGF